MAEKKVSTMVDRLASQLVEKKDLLMAVQKAARWVDEKAAQLAVR